MIIEKADITAAVLKAVSKEFNVSESAIIGREKSRQVAIARFHAIYALKKLTTSSLSQIGDAVNRVNHSTIISALNVMTAIVESGGDDAKRVRRVLKAIRDSFPPNVKWPLMVKPKPRGRTQLIKHVA